ncbi:RICIN domain-containing protein [Streptomyces sp. NPDC047046]|uniref:RICIN domain-containing protein n=1 Tax=Streptomyces sp. NPDC047046 TaxID=3155378 RepID=UPI0033F0CE7B
MPAGSGSWVLQCHWLDRAGTRRQWVVRAAVDHSSTGNTPYTLVDPGSGLVVDVTKESETPGTALQRFPQWTATGNTHQIWTLG